MSNNTYSDIKMAQTGRHPIRKQNKPKNNFAEKFKNAFEEKYKCEEDQNPQKGKCKQGAERTSIYPVKLVEKDDGAYEPQKEQEFYVRERSKQEVSPLKQAQKKLSHQDESDQPLQKQKSCLKHQLGSEETAPKKGVSFSVKNEEQVLQSNAEEGLEEIKQEEVEDEVEEDVGSDGNEDEDEEEVKQEICQDSPSKSNLQIISDSPLNATGSDSKKQLRATDASITGDNIKTSPSKLQKTKRAEDEAVLSNGNRTTRPQKSQSKLKEEEQCKVTAASMPQKDSSQQVQQSSLYSANLAPHAKTPFQNNNTSGQSTSFHDNNPFIDPNKAKANPYLSSSHINTGGIKKIQ